MTPIHPFSFLPHALRNASVLAAALALAGGAGAAQPPAPVQDGGQASPPATGQPLAQPGNSGASASGTGQPSAPVTQQTAPPDTQHTAQRFQALDSNRNETIDPQEARTDGALSREFDRLDANSDGQLSQSEFATFGAGDSPAGDASPAQVQQLREEAKADGEPGTKPTESWFTVPEQQPDAGDQGK